MPATSFSPTFTHALGAPTWPPTDTSHRVVVGSIAWTAKQNAATTDPGRDEGILQKRLRGFAYEPAEHEPYRAAAERQNNRIRRFFSVHCPGSIAESLQNPAGTRGDRQGSLPRYALGLVSSVARRSRAAHRRHGKSLLASLQAAVGALAAVWARHRTGRGQLVDEPLHAAAVAGIGTRYRGRPGG
jgi:hypothetical protein